MPVLKPFAAWKLRLHAFYDRGRLILPMRLRLFLFLMVFLNTMVLGVILILFAGGVFDAGVREHKPVLQSELIHLKNNISQTFKQISANAVFFAHELSQELEQQLQEYNRSPDLILEEPELLEVILEASYEKLNSALTSSGASGALLLLNGTSNPLLAEDERSRAGLYLRSFEPMELIKPIELIGPMGPLVPVGPLIPIGPLRPIDLIGSIGPIERLQPIEPKLGYNTKTVVNMGVGPEEIADRHGLQLLPQWRRELAMHDHPDLVQRLADLRGGQAVSPDTYYWSKASEMPSASGRGMLCTVPITAADGTVYGLLGLEVNEILFQESFSPAADGYEDLLAMLSPYSIDSLDLSGALIAGDFAEEPAGPEPTAMAVLEGRDDFEMYRQADEEHYSGLHETITLYPEGSVHEDEIWVVSLMMPDEGLSHLLSSGNRTISLSLLFLFALNIVLALFISRRYVRPVIAALEQVKKPNEASRTNIPEIDHLIEYLVITENTTKLENTERNLIQNDSLIYREFVENIKALSGAEKAVFDLYAEGNSAREIAEILCLSINTIKTHNRRIYMKLNVASRKELMVFIRMMDETNPTPQET